MAQHFYPINKLPDIQAKIQYPCFVAYDALSMALKIVKAYPANLLIHEFDTEISFPSHADTSMSFQLIILEGNQKNMTLITPLSGDNMYSDYLDSFGEGFHHNSILCNNYKEYQVHLNDLIEAGFKIIQILSKAEVMESCILNQPDNNYMVELLFISELSNVN